MGWSLGTNDAANVFGTAVSTRVIKYRTAVILIAVFVILGAFVGGDGNINKVSSLAISNGVVADNVFNSALIAAIIFTCAAITVSVMSYLKLPVSANQSITGAIIGWGFIYAESMSQNLPEILKFVSTWVISPLASAFFCFLFVRLSNRFLVPKISKLYSYDRVVKIGYIISGIFTAYSLGTNSSASVIALYYGENNLITNARTAAVIGAAAIALGVITYSKRVMYTVGNSISELTPINGFLVVLATAVTIQLFSLKAIGINIPVSTSQAVVGAVIGAGLAKSHHSVNFRVLKKIGLAWVSSPTIAGAMAAFIGFLLRNFFA